VRRTIGERLRAWPHLMARLLQGAPWWVLPALGLFASGLGVFLILNPVASLSRYSLSIGLGLALSGLADLASVPRSPRRLMPPLVAIAWILAGVLIAAWPDAQVAALVAIGVCALAAGAVSHLSMLPRVAGAERRTVLLLGLLDAALAVLALLLPLLTLLGITMLFGVRTLFSGVRLTYAVISALRSHRGPEAVPGT
jgi:uncharacterized membrane protein HdeD (DUF308 family)